MLNNIVYTKQLYAVCVKHFFNQTHDAVIADTMHALQMHANDILHVCFYFPLEFLKQNR